MEASAVLTLAALGGSRAGVVCAVYAQRVEGVFVEGEQQDRAEAACVETALESLGILAQMDRQVIESGAARWHPSLWRADS
jgi:uridine phosphorylase